jgi:demethylphylloquinone reductase
MNRTEHPTIILGGGFVGLFTALHLEQQNYPHPIILIEQRDRFVFKPLLYELLTGELHLKHICPSYTQLLSGSRVSFVQDTITEINLKQRWVMLSSGKGYNYGNLVLSLGSTTTYFKTPGASENTFPFTSKDEVMRLGTHLQNCLHQARQTKDPQKRQQLLTVAIVGAGPAGVELASTLADILPVWYDAIGGDYEEIRIVLVNRSTEILKGDINSQLRDTVKDSLSRRTVAVRLLVDAAVTQIQQDGINYKMNGTPDFLAAGTIAWTAGTQPHPLLKQLPVAPEYRTQRGQLQVTPTLQLPDFPEVFVGGDCAHVSSHPQPATAQVAYQQGKAIANNLQAIATGGSPVPAHVNLRGTLMKLGIGEGVANLFNRLEIKGELGHLIRNGTYLELLPTPVHNFKATAEWLTDEFFQRHQPQTIHHQHYGRTPLLAGVTAVLASVLIAIPFIWYAAYPEHFQKTMTRTGMPALLKQQQ